MDSGMVSNVSLQETDKYIMLDPRAPRSSPMAACAPVQHSQFTEGIVFVMGSTGYVEYGNLEGWAGKAG